MFAVRLSFFIYFLIGALASAQAELRLQLEADAWLQGHRQWDNGFNPNNQTLGLPTADSSFQLRPEIMNLEDHYRWVLRPIWQMDTKQVAKGTGESDVKISSQGKSNITDAYIEWHPTDDYRVVAGLEIYQWGPAELMNTSNPLFHLNTQAHNGFYKEKGQAIVRTSRDLNDNWNTMLIFNPVSNAEPAWRSEATFKPTGFLKAEYRSTHSNDYIGLLAGSQTDGLPFVGEYAVYSLDTGEAAWSFYTDARHTRGDRGFKPVRNAFGFNEMQQVDDNSKTHTLGILGVRWESNVDIRVEYFINSAAMSASEFKDGVNSVKTLSPWQPANLARFFQSGYELPGQNYIYASIRIPNLGRKSDKSLSFRQLLSQQDGSGLLQTSFDSPLNDSLVLILEGSVTYGGAERELTLGDQASALAGLKWTL